MASMMENLPKDNLHNSIQFFAVKERGQIEICTKVIVYIDYSYSHMTYGCLMQ